MKSLSFSDGLEEYSLNDRVTVRFNPTDASFLERLAELFSRLDALQEESGGTAVFADKFTTAQLQQYLTDIENDIKQH